jgi:hypothetical protein
MASVFLFSVILLAFMLLMLLYHHSRAFDVMLHEQRKIVDELRRAAALNNVKEHRDGTERHSTETTEQEREQGKH